MLCYLCYFQHSHIQSKILLYRNPFHLFNHLNGAMPNLPQCAQQCPHKVLTMYFVLNNVLKMSSKCPHNVLNNVLTMSSQFSNNVLKMSSKCPHNVLTMSSKCSNNVHRSVEQCHYTYVTQFRPTQEEDLSFLFFTCICIRFLIVPGLHLYLCQVCTENFRKRCQISFKQQAFNETVTFEIF